MNVTSDADPISHQASASRIQPSYPCSGLQIRPSRVCHARVNSAWIRSLASVKVCLRSSDCIRILTKPQTLRFQSWTLMLGREPRVMSKRDVSVSPIPISSRQLELIEQLPRARLSQGPTDRDVLPVDRHGSTALRCHPFAVSGAETTADCYEADLP